MASNSWQSLEPPLNKVILSVIEDEFKFEKMTPVQVRFDFTRNACAMNNNQKEYFSFRRKHRYHY